MTNPTPRDSAQLPFPHHPEHAMTWMDSEKRVIQAYAEAYAREALRAQALTAPNLACKSAQARLATQWGYVRAASVEPVVAERNQCDGCMSGLKLDGSMHRDANGRSTMICQASRYAGAPPAHIPAVEALHMGACITEGRLYATVMRKERNGHVTVVATAEMDVEALKGHDCIATMKSIAQHPTPEPAQAVDAVIDAIDWVDNFVARCNGDDRGSNDSVNLIRAALQASRQPQAQQAVAEGAGGEDAARWQFVMDWGNKDFAVCKRVGVTGTCWEPIKTSGPVDAALATKDRS